MDATIRSIDAGLSLTAVLLNGAFVLLTLTRTSLTRVYVTFMLNCLATIVWNFGDFMVFKTGDDLWHYLSLIGTGILPAAIFHFISALVGLTVRRRWYAAAYVICLPFILSGPLALVHIGIRSLVDDWYKWNAPYTILLLVSFTFGIVLLRRAHRRAASAGERSRIRYVLAALCVAFCTGMTELLQSDQLPFNRPPPLGHLGTVIYTSIFALGVFKHRAAYDLLAAMRTKLDMLNELAAGIAHELRNPLSSIKGVASLLCDKAGEISPGKSGEYLNLISEEVDRLDAILANYHNLVRPVKIEREPIGINRVLEKTVALMRMKENAPRTELSLSPEIPLCHSDALTLKQVFINLIKNAYEACGPNGDLEITTTYTAPWVRITFKDSGGGLAPEILTRVFEPFVSTKENGMGLGLAICRRLIDLNGGTIEAANEKDGACFIIHLPAAEDLRQSSNFAKAAALSEQ